MLSSMMEIAVKETLKLLSGMEGRTANDEELTRIRSMVYFVTRKYSDLLKINEKLLKEVQNENFNSVAFGHAIDELHNHIHGKTGDKSKH